MSTNPQATNSNGDDSASLPDGFPARPAVSSDELLPPVEPPSAGFIIQLFVVPAVIVLCVVLLWLLVTTLATQGDQDPTKIVAALRSSNQARWQKAEELATMLRPDLEQRYPGLKSNQDLASQLAQLLDEEIEAQLDDDNSVKLRYFLCRVLGEFYVDDGLPALLRAARDDEEILVRRAAINAISVLSSGLRKQEPPLTLDDPQLVETLASLANEQEDLIRSEVAFTLGVLTMDAEADPQLTAELELLVEDLYSDARYNAALGLARSGNLKALGAVAEMFDPEALKLNIAGEKILSLQVAKRNKILDNALRAAKSLQEKNAGADLTPLKNAVSQFVETASEWDLSPVPQSLIQRGRELVADASGS